MVELLLRNGLICTVGTDQGYGTVPEASEAKPILSPVFWYIATIVDSWGKFSLIDKVETEPRGQM